MTSRWSCLFLTFVLVAAWTGDLKAGTFVTSSPTGTPEFGQEVYPIGRLAEAKVRQALAYQWLPPMHVDAQQAVAVPADHVWTPLLETTPRILRNADACYLLMSLRW